MPNTIPFTARLLDDEELPPPNASPAATSEADWTRPGMSRPAPAPSARLAPAPGTKLPPLRPAQRACYDALGLALKEGHVFAALTGPAGCGKTTVLEAVIADLRDRSLRCIRIGDPDKVPAKLAAQIEQVAYAEAGKPENLDRHIVLVVDDAHAGSEELLRCLTRLAAMREPGRRVPQVLLVGAPELWNRLAAEEYEALERRLAIRAVLPPPAGGNDPWASVEQEVTQVPAAVHGAQAPGEDEVPPAPSAAHGSAPVAAPGFERAARALPMPDPVRAEADGAAAPPNMYALFPDPPPRGVEPLRAESRRHLLLPLGVLLVSVAACAGVLSFYDWPDVFDGLPWADKQPAAPFVIPPSPRAQSSGLPQPPAWAQSSQRTPPQATPAQTTQAPAPAPPAPEQPVVAAPPPATPAPEPPAATASPPAAAAEQPIAAAPPPPQAEPSAEQAAPPAVAPPARNAVAEPPPSQQASAAAPAPPLAPAEARSVRPAATAPAAPVAQAAPLAPQIITLLLRRGNEQFAIGDVSGARLLYQRAAEAGSAQGARLEAQTYDEAFLPRADASTLADRDAARLWYSRAAALGDAEAATRLKTLNQGR